MSFCQIYQNESLYGHSLTSAPDKIWAFSKNEFCLADRPDPGTLVVDKDYLIAKAVHYQKGDAYIYRTVFIYERPLFDSIEFIGRRVLGLLATLFSYLVLAPTGFTVKLLHLSMQEISQYIQSTNLARNFTSLSH